MPILPITGLLAKDASKGTGEGMLEGGHFRGEKEREYCVGMHAKGDPVWTIRWQSLGALLERLNW